MKVERLVYNSYFGSNLAAHDIWPTEKDLASSTTKNRIVLACLVGIHLIIELKDTMKMKDSSPSVGAKMN